MFLTKIQYFRQEELNSFSRLYNARPFFLKFCLFRFDFFETNQLKIAIPLLENRLAVCKPICAIKCFEIFQSFIAGIAC